MKFEKVRIDMMAKWYTQETIMLCQYQRNKDIKKR